MDAAELLRHLVRCGCMLEAEADGHRLTVTGALPDELRQSIRDHKAELLALLEAKREAFEERAAIMEFDGRMTRKDAEAAATELPPFIGIAMPPGVALETIPTTALAQALSALIADERQRPTLGNVLAVLGRRGGVSFCLMTLTGELTC